jgi:Ras-related protein Rab-8A
MINPGVEEAFYNLARDIKKRLIDTAGKEEQAKGNINVNQKQGAAPGGCC